jgi:hypothetical protein
MNLDLHIFSVGLVAVAKVKTDELKWNKTSVMEYKMNDDEVVMGVATKNARSHSACWKIRKQSQAIELVNQLTGTTLR